MYSSQDVRVAEANVTVAANATTVISKEFHIRGQEAFYFIAEVTSASGTYGSAITLKLQTKMGNGDWTDSKTASVASDTTTVLRINKDEEDAAGIRVDDAFIPLRPLARLVMVAPAGNNCTVTRCDILRNIGN